MAMLSIKINARRSAAVVAISLGLTSIAFAQDAKEQSKRSYAILSLIGDKLEVVTQVPKVGSYLDRNRHEIIPIHKPVFDNPALVSSEKAITQREPNAKVTLLRNNEPKLFELQERSLEATSEGNEFIKEVFSIAKDVQASHIILVAKYRAEANLEALGAHLGHGKLKGLGFYIDRTKRTRRSDTGEIGIGFLAPYCYIKVLLIETQTGTLQRSESVARGTTLSAARAKDSMHPWDVLSPQEKITTIERMVKSETEKLVSLVLTE
jgi:hypothetical protein